jgi:hypothetical protein
MKRLVYIAMVISFLYSCKSDIEKEIDKFVESFTGNWKISKITYYGDESLTKIDSNIVYTSSNLNFSGNCKSQSCEGSVSIYGQSADINYNPYNRDSQIFITTPPKNGVKIPNIFFNGVYDVSESGNNSKILTGKIRILEKEKNVKVLLEK